MMTTNAPRLSEEEMDQFLEHYGIPGMKWGVRRTPEQLGYKVSKTKQKAGGILKSLNESLAIKKKNKAKKKARKEAAKKKANEEKALRDAAKKKEQDEKIREKLLSAGNEDLDFIYEHRSLLTNQELETKLKRVNAENAFKKMIADRPSEYDKAMKTIKKIHGTMEDVNKMWNSNSGKALRKALGFDISTEKKESGKKESEKKESGKKEAPGKVIRDLNYLSKNIGQLSDEDINATIKRLTSENNLRNVISSTRTAWGKERETELAVAKERRQQSIPNLDYWKSYDPPIGKDDMSSYLERANSIQRSAEQNSARDNSNDDRRRKNR